MTVGERMKQLRESIGMSQVDLSRMIHVSKQTLYKYENGIVTNIPSDKIEAAARVLNVEPAYLMGWKEDDRDLTDTERRLLDLFRQLPESGQYEIIGYARRTLEEYRKEKESPSATA